MTAVVTALEDRRTMTELEDLDPITLTDLAAYAELLTRVDRKYLVPIAALPGVLARVGSAARVLDIDGQRQFGYHSVYWDTAELDSFRRSGQGRRRRFKVRSRTYLDSGTSFLEVKTRGPRGTTVKERILHPEIAGPALDTAGSAYVAEQLVAAGVPGIAAAELSPSLVTTYRRATLVAAMGGAPVRATIDTDLTWQLPGTSDDVVRLRGLAVIETKGSSSPSPVDRALWRLGHRPVRLSKYGTGMAVLRNDVPDLKWHNVIHRHLTTEWGEQP